jgi:hypothetical protein
VKSAAHTAYALRKLIRSLAHEVSEQEAAPYLERIALEHPHTAREMVVRQLLLLELEEQGVLRPL